MVPFLNIRQITLNCFALAIIDKSNGWPFIMGQPPNLSSVPHLILKRWFRTMHRLSSRMLRCNATSSLGFRAGPVWMFISNLSNEFCSVVFQTILLKIYYLAYTFPEAGIIPLSCSVDPFFNPPGIKAKCGIDYTDWCKTVKIGVG